MSYVVTGGCGFIGSNFANMLSSIVDEDILIFDKMTYAASTNNIIDSPNIRLLVGDLANDTDTLNNIFEHNTINGVFHFAAESHVDNSITSPKHFIDANIVGTFNLLEAVRNHGNCRMLHVSTDEVYGALDHDGPSFLETKLLEPNNVYSASKASSDLLVRSYCKTYGLNIVTTRCCNNYGPRQHVEKLIPKVISNALQDQNIPVYGSGDNVREWIYVKDHCRAIWDVFSLGKSCETYNIGTGKETSNLDLVKSILKVLEKPYNLIKFVKDRPGHDFRYSIDSSKFMNLVCDFNFTDFDYGIAETVEWYKKCS